MGRLLIVSNRLPVTVKAEEGEFRITPSAGGLATGMRGPHEGSDSLWIGWPGELPRLSDARREELEQRLAEFRTAPVYLSQTEVNRYYEGFANGVLWPLFHYLTDRVRSDAWKDWQAYSEVNERFAQRVAAEYRPGDTVWVHDYQLCLVPVLLRQLVPEARIGFFLHIPFPSSDVFRILPWRTEILEGILGSDLVGFHTYPYLCHFSRSLNLLLGVEPEGERLMYANREVRLGVFPMGIDAARFSALAGSAEVAEEVESIREELGKRKLLLGVDRLDYSKGLPERMLAMERFLEREPSWRGKIRFIQVVVPSRTKVESYKAFRRNLDELVGRVNGRYATIDSVPIHYLFQSVSENQLVALYRAADVMLVTPLRDGMNLVAKEFVASRRDGDGVLVLSEFAGAAAELAEALQVNPYDADAAATAIHRALTMPREERRARMAALQRRVFTYDAYRWADTFRKRLQEPPAAEVDRMLSPAGLLQELAGRLRAAKRLVLILDYDGTLAPYASSPQLAEPDAELKRLLQALSSRPGTSVHVVSGRSRELMSRWFGRLPLGLHAEHGFWSRLQPGGEWRPLKVRALDWKRRILPLIELVATRTPGSLIEEKTAAITWYYRMSDPELGARRFEELRRLLEKEASGLPLEVMTGPKSLEVRVRGVHKGAILDRLGAKRGITLLAMGDDATDEDLFGALPAGGTAVHVGRGPSSAAYRLADPAAARSFLASLLG